MRITSSDLPAGMLRHAMSKARRSSLSLFLIKVFETLHPGEPLLTKAWYIDAMCHALCEVQDGTRTRLLINVPPRHLKSVTAAVAFTAWVLGHEPTAKIMVASYSQDLAREHANLTRTIMESHWYAQDFPATRISQRGNRALELQTTLGGVRKAVSVDGSVTGFGADIIIVDDCMKADDAHSPERRLKLRSWLDNTLLSRLNDKATGRIVSIQQRLHEDDLPAYMLEKGYDHLNLPAVAEKDEAIPIGRGLVHQRRVGDLLNPEREPLDVLDRLRRELGPVVYAAQYQQDPVVPGGNMIRIEWFGTYDQPPERHDCLKVVQSWDTGMSSEPTSDWSAGLTWGFTRDYKWHLLDVYRARLDYPDLKRAMERQWRLWRPDSVIIEKAASGWPLFQDFRATGPFKPIMITPAASKEERFNGCLAEVEAGHFHLPCQAPWLEGFRHELKAFPNGRHDDQVDAFAQFVNYQRSKWLWLMTEFSPEGRASSMPRHRKRPW